MIFFVLEYFFKQQNYGICSVTYDFEEFYFLVPLSMRSNVFLKWNKNKNQISS